MDSAGSELKGEAILGLLVITATFDRIVKLSIAYLEGRITANDFADTVTRVIHDAEPRIPKLELS